LCIQLKYYLTYEINFTYLFAFIAILASIPLYSQSKATISGKVIDSKTSEIMSYASIRVLDAKTEKLITGGITTEKGIFSLQVPLEFIEWLLNLWVTKSGNLIF
jgi:hypothetical protein